MPLQKSYSERVGLTKRSPWQRSRSNPVNFGHQNSSRPLEPISEKTKTKLSKFQYNKPAVDLAGDEPASKDGKPMVAEGQVEGGEGGNAVTPAPSKFSWRELVEPGVSVEEDGHKSPNERIMWDTANKPTTLSPMMLQRKGKKRARSSSPVSSPAKETHTTPTVNVKKLTAAFKSPYADPTLELWDRYSFHRSGATTPVKGMTNPAMAQLMVSSSPQPAAAARPKANLRRSISHGLNWPKRRKIDKTKSYSNSNEEQREMEAASKSSLVTALLDTVTDTFSGMGEEDAVDHPMRSPSRNKRDLKPRAHSPSPAPTKAAVQPIAPASSDYGDDDFDDDMFLEMEAVVTATQAAKPETPPAEASKVTDETSLLGDFEDLDDDDIFDDVQGLDSVSPSAQRQRALPPPKTLTPKKPKPAPNGVDDSNGLDADFSDLDDEDIDFDAVELAATQSAKTQEHDLPTARKKTIQRYLVTNVLDGEFVDDRGATRMEKILLIQADGSKVMKTVLLRGSWFDTPAHAESYVHVIGDFDNRGRCIVDDAHNLLILHPDQLISATVVADSFGCMRRAVLQDRVKATSEAAPPLVYGTILHEIFQEALMANNWDRAFLSKVIERTTEKHLEDLYTIKVSLAIAREHLESKMAEVTHWASTFVAAQPQREATVEGRGGDKLNMAVTKLLDVEEHVWSPMYGLKGNIDATIEVAMTNGKKTRNLTVPFEVKTGKHANSNHMAQTALYTLLLSDRYDIEIAYGILYYMETSKTMQIPAVRHELRHMIMQRNQLACYVRERSVQLPPMLRNKHMCGKCYAKTSCFVYHRLADDGDGETSNMKEKFDELVHHLTPRHQEFFIKWENLLTKEEKESQKNKRELWTMTSHEREKKSRCFADVIIEEGSASVDSGGPRINRFHYTFVKRIPIPGFSFLESELNVGEPIVVSDEEGHFALAIGYITSVKKNRVTVAVDRRLHNARTREPRFDEEDNQAFASIMRVAAKGSTQQNAQGKTKEPLIRYRLDQDEFSNGMATVRNNLVQMMANDVPQAPMTRKLVVDLVAPRFKDIATQYSVTDGESLNVDQKKAIEKVMSAQDYALVLGMPGTGKTTTIAHIIRALVSQGKSVLLTSHTHTAVDNILLKLKTDNIPILRLGAPAKVHPEVHDFVNLASLPKSSFDEIRDSWHGTPIVATTCLGINHHVFNERSFDYCIVDEASQITLPICAGPIRMAKTFVLVGDHNQLPPVVKNEEARLGGLDVSLFKLLSDTHPQSVVNLEHQYRMCEDIMTLSNTLIYEGRLRCGFEALKKRKLDVPNMGALRYRHYDAASITQPGTPLSFCTGGAPSRCWLYDLLEGEARVRFVNTDTLQPAVREEAHGKRIVNSAEVRIVSQLVDSLITVGVPSEEIGVMTHYRSQLFMLKDELKGRAGVEMHTTDRFQGRDKEVIVLSLVRSNDACNIGDLLKDWRRINVAFTRAKTKLLVVGSVGTLRGSGKENMLSKFITLMEGRDWIYDLPADALLSHHFDDLATQTTTTGLTPKAKTPRRMGLSPKKMMQGGGPAAGKENRRPSPKRATIGDRALLRGKPIMRDILNEMTNGAY